MLNLSAIYENAANVAQLRSIASGVPAIFRNAQKKAIGKHFSVLARTGGIIAKT